MQVIQISIKNDYNKLFPNFKGTKAVTQIAKQQTEDVFIKNIGNITKSTEKIMIKGVKDILDFLKVNKDKIDNGKIFNIPVTAMGSTLLSELARFDKNEDNEYLYELLCNKMSELEDIDYKQTDNLGFSLFDKAVISENKEFLNYLFSKGVIHEQNVLESIDKVKNPEFKKELETVGKKCEDEFNNLINEFSKEEYMAPNRYNWSSKKEIPQSSLELLRNNIKQYKYGTEQFLKKDKQAFVRSLRDIGVNFLGLKANSFYSIEKRHIDSLFALTDYNKELFKDLLIDILSRDEEHIHVEVHDIISGMLLPIFDILKDDPAGFCDVIKNYKPDRDNLMVEEVGHDQEMRTFMAICSYVKMYAPEDKFVHLKNLMPYFCDDI